VQPVTGFQVESVHSMDDPRLTQALFYGLRLPGLSLPPAASKAITFEESFWNGDAFIHPDEAKRVSKFAL
jgi:hypothetical protein